MAQLGSWPAASSNWPRSWSPGSTRPVRWPSTRCPRPSSSPRRDLAGLAAAGLDLGGAGGRPVVGEQLAALVAVALVVDVPVVARPVASTRCPQSPGSM